MPVRPRLRESESLRLAFVITGLGCGGAERRLTDLVSRLAARGHSVVVLVLHGQEAFFTPEAGVQLRFFELERPTGSRWSRQLRRVQWIWRVVRDTRPELVVSFIDVANALTLLALSVERRIPVVVSERVFPPRHRVPRHIALLRRLLYPHAAALVAPSEGIAVWARRRVDPSKVWVIPNPVRPPANPVAVAGGDRVRSPLVCAMGRLEPQKGFDLLLKAFAEVAATHGDWHLVIFGEGRERPALERLAGQLGIAERVSMSGTTHDAESALRECEIFVCSSRYEGFPNALAEAMASGCAVISTDCPTGPSDLIRDGEDGLLVPPEDRHALAVALERLMADDVARRRLGEAAAGVPDRFEPGRSVAAWEHLLRSLVKERPR